MSNRKEALKTVRELRSAGFEAFFAGGCVRDMLLRRRPKDYDVATNARPAQVMKLFRRTLKVGAKFGVVIVLYGQKQVEVATFRTDQGYKDGRHPTGVRFTTAVEDAKRRDFTINGMFYDPIERRVIDYVNGQADLQKKLIRTIGPAAQRFSEDYLRMLRAVRFSAQLGFAIEDSTWQSIKKLAPKISSISGERIAMELEGILTCPARAYGAKLLIESGLAEAIFPGYTLDRANQAIGVLERLSRDTDFITALAALFCNWPADEALERCKVLKLSRAQMRFLKALLQNRGALLDADMPLAKLRRLAAEPYFDALYNLQRAIQKASSDSRRSIVPLIRIKQRLRALGPIELTPKPLLDGHELIRLGLKPGPVLGRVAEKLYDAQLEGIIKNKDQARKWVEQWLAKNKFV